MRNGHFSRSLLAKLDISELSDRSSHPKVVRRLAEEAMHRRYWPRGQRSLG